ncbi:twin-arginine translocation signal domain-containing protein [Streptomyces sp. NPDC099050]|uniref:twin-arginine translocation signal domain-containing protein n=1 Tax=Streptomyces sp. NPDC099050 TaxID=3366100 RepID=UPI00382615B1
MNEHVARRLDRRGFLTAAGATAAGAALAAVGGQALATFRPSAAGAAAGYSVPIDTVRHTRTWMAWPDSSAIWGRQLAGVQANIALIAKYEPVVMCANFGERLEGEERLRLGRHGDRLDPGG